MSIYRKGLELNQTEEQKNNYIWEILKSKVIVAYSSLFDVDAMSTSLSISRGQC